MEITRTVSALPRGTALSRYCMAKALRDDLRAMAIAQEQWRGTPEVYATLKAAQDAGGVFGSWGSELAMYGIGRELIEALRPMVIVDRLAGSMRRVGFLTRTARETDVLAEGAWVGEGKPTPASAAAFDLVTIAPTKAACIVVLSRDLLRFSNPSAEADLRTQLIKGIAKFLDGQFLDPSVAPSAGVNPGAITHNADAVTSTGTTAAEKLADLLAMIKKLTDNNVPMLSPFWIMKPATAIALASTYNTAGNLQFPNITAIGGTLLGINVLTSNTSPAQITLLDASQILLADDGNADIQGSDEASLQMVDNPNTGAQSLVSLWQNNLFGLRAVREITWQAAHDDGNSPAAVIPRAVTYMSVSY